MTKKSQLLELTDLFLRLLTEMGGGLSPRSAAASLLDRTYDLRDKLRMDVEKEGGSRMKDVKKVDFLYGKVVMSDRVSQRISEDTMFSYFVLVSLVKRHLIGDWGEVCEEDARTNNEALKNGLRLFSVYEYPERPELKIWIITEADRSATTILFPDEY